MFFLPCNPNNVFTGAEEKNALELEAEICALNHYDILTSLLTCCCFPIRYRTMAVTTRLTWNEEKRLQKLLGNVSLRLLYKSSVHQSDIFYMLERCIHQGPTVTIIYFSEVLWVVFMLEHYPEKSDELTRPNPSLKFSFRKDRESEITGILETEMKIVSKQLEFYFFGKKEFSVDLGKAILSTYTSKDNDSGQNFCHNTKFLECEVFRVEGMLN